MEKKEEVKVEEPTKVEETKKEENKTALVAEKTPVQVAPKPLFI